MTGHSKLLIDSRLCVELVDRLELVAVDEVASERRLLLAAVATRRRRRQERRQPRLRRRQRLLLDGVEAEEPFVESSLEHFRHLENFFVTPGSIILS